MPKCDEPLSNVALRFNLRRYITAGLRLEPPDSPDSRVHPTDAVSGRGRSSPPRPVRPTSNAVGYGGGWGGMLGNLQHGVLRLAHSKLSRTHMQPLHQALASARGDGDGDGAGGRQGTGVTGLDLRHNVLDAAAMELLVEALVEVATAGGYTRPFFS